MSLWETFRLDHELEMMHGDLNPKARKVKNKIPSYSPRNTGTSLYPPVFLAADGPVCREQKIQWGQRKALKKAINSSVVPGVDCYSDGTKVVYRKREDWSRPQGYVACTFLDQYDTVLACDHSGTIDLVRLPSYAEDAKPRKLGQVLVDNLEMSVWKDRPFTPKIKSIRSGNAFVVGLGGSYHVFASERARKWGDDLQLESSHFSQRSPSAFIATSWTLHGPRRKFYRDMQNPDLSLVSIATSGRGITHMGDFHEMLQEIQGWDSRNPKERKTLRGSSFFPRRRAKQAAKWDFLETNSSLLAAQVDSEEDSFWLRLVDDRVHDPVVCVDQTSRDSRNQCEEHITACAFASSTCLATAHVVTCSDPTPRVPATTHAKDMASKKVGHMDAFVKLWDIRMMSASRGENELSTIRLPQFPFDKAVAVKPESVTCNEFGGQDKVARDFVISDLSASANGGGTIILTAQSRWQSVSEHFSLNLGYLGLESIHTQKGDQEHLLHSASESHGVLACVENQNEIALFDVRSSRKPSPQRCNKRRSNGTSKDDEEFSNKLRYCIRPELKDRHGLKTQLSCISMNPAGTSLIGGSIDGDLFVWRGL